MSQAWLAEARGRAGAAIRAIDATAADPAHDREARRVMEIAAARYQYHYLTERSASNLRIGPELVALLLDNGAALHGALQRIAGVQLQVNDEQDAIRLDGLDGVGKELVRRAMSKLMKKPEAIDDARKDPEGWATRGREHLSQEIRALGKRAFHVLGIQKAHPEIVELVGALNFRTSYTQNQWWHAVEASYLAGMMAAELGLDEKLNTRDPAARGEPARYLPPACWHRRCGRRCSPGRSSEVSRSAADFSSPRAARAKAPRDSR